MPEEISRQDYSDDYFQCHVMRYEDMDEWAKQRISTVLQIVEPSEEDLILDIGCGMGTMSMECGKRGSGVIGVDFSKDGLKIANSLKKRQKLNRVCFCHADVTSLPFKDNVFDKAVAADLVEHLYPYQFSRAVKEWHRILTNKGSLIVYTPILRENNAVSKTFSLLYRLLSAYLPFSKYTNSTTSSEDKRKIIDDHNRQYLKKLHVDEKKYEPLRKELSKYFLIKKIKITRTQIPRWEFIISRFPIMVKYVGGHVALLAEKKSVYG